MATALDKQLLDTIIFYNGLYFTLRSDEEHQQLRYRPSQLRLVEPENATPYIMYTKDVSKANQGGLLHSKKESKQVIQHANIENPHSCIV